MVLITILVLRHRLEPNSRVISAIFGLDCPAGLGIFKGKCPLLTLGGSKVSIKGNFKGKVRKKGWQSGLGRFCNFFILFACGKGKNPIPTHV